MPDIMIVDLRDGWNPSEATSTDALFETNSRHAFLDKWEAYHNSGRLAVVCAQDEDSDVLPVEISQEDFYANTLNPILHKGRAICGDKAVLRTHRFDGHQLVFVFGTQNVR